MKLLNWIKKFLTSESKTTESADDRTPCERGEHDWESLPPSTNIRKTQRYSHTGSLVHVEYASTENKPVAWVYSLDAPNDRVCLICGECINESIAFDLAYKEQQEAASKKQEEKIRRAEVARKIFKNVCGEERHDTTMGKS